MLIRFYCNFLVIIGLLGHAEAKPGAAECKIYCETRKLCPNSDKSWRPCNEELEEQCFCDRAPVWAWIVVGVSVFFSAIGIIYAFYMQFGYCCRAGRINSDSRAVVAQPIVSNVAQNSQGGWPHQTNHVIQTQPFIIHSPT